MDTHLDITYNYISFTVNIILIYNTSICDVTNIYSKFREKGKLVEIWEREQESEKQVIGASEVREREGEAFENILVGGADLATLSLFSKIWRDGAHVRKKSQVLIFCSFFLLQRPN